MSEQPPPGPTLTERASHVARDTIRDMRPQPLFHFGTPELGWPLATSLWFVILINGLEIALYMLLAVGVQLLSQSTYATHFMGAIMWLPIFFPGCA